VTLKTPQGLDNGVRFVDLNGDGYDDIVFSNAERYGVYLFNPVEKKNVDWRLGWTFVMREGKAGDANSIPPIVRADGSSNGVTFKDGAMWVANEDTAKLPDKVLRIPYSELLRQPGPPPRTPEESLKALHVKKGFKAELAAAEPLVQDPVWIDWDAKGRMWVVEMGDYPFHEQNGKTYSGRVKILESTKGDGIYDKVTLFLDGLTYPTGLTPWKNGVFVVSVPDVFFVEEHDGALSAAASTGAFRNSARKPRSCKPSNQKPSCVCCPLPRQINRRRVRHGHPRGAHHDGVLDDQPSPTAEKRKSMLYITEIRHPRFRCRAQKRQRDQRHDDDQGAPHSGDLRQPRIEGNHQSIQHNHRAEANGEGIGVIGLMPGTVRRHERPLGIDVFGVVWWGIFVEEVHDPTVRHKRHDAVRLILVYFQGSNPNQHDDQS
jgi:hypothetical protein